MNEIINNLVCILANETAKELNESQDKLNNIKWNIGEANLDFEYSQLACSICENVWNKIKDYYYVYKDISIKFYIPDINLQITLPNNKIIIKKIELKTSKNKIMIGSTIKNLDINQPLIYCLRPKKNHDKYIIKCSLYHNAIGEGEYDLFQDRTPRPSINFEKMDDYILQYVEKNNSLWIEHYADCSLNRINYNMTKPCNYSWQDDMIKMIKHKILNEFIQNTSIEEFSQLKMIKQIENIDL